MTETLEITSARTEDIDPAGRAEIIALCIEAHQEQSFQNLFIYVPSGGLHFLGRTGSQLVSHAMVTTRWLQPEGQPVLKTAYIDAVSTLPACQGRGYASAVMRRLANEIEKDYLIACLETDRLSFYERLGWQAWRGPLAGRDGQGLVPTPGQTGVMILRLLRTPALSLEALLTIECQSGRIW